MRRTIRRRKASAETSIVTTDPCADPDRVNGPDRLSVRRPEGGEVVPADQDRPGSAIAATSSGVPHPERLRSRSGLRGPFQTV